MDCRQLAGAVGFFGHVFKSIQNPRDSAGEKSAKDESDQRHSDRSDQENLVHFLMLRVEKEEENMAFRQPTRKSLVQVVMVVV